MLKSQPGGPKFFDRARYAPITHMMRSEKNACEWAAYARLRPEGIEQQHDDDGECGDDLHDEMPGFKI
jgi:hypothetical protein